MNKKMSTFFKKAIPFLLGIISFLLLWSALSLYFTDYLVPSPYKVLKEIFFLFIQERLDSIVFITIYRSFIAFVIAVLIGSIIGIISGLSGFLEKYFFIPTIILQGAPPLLWIVPVILLFNVGDVSVIVVSTLIVTPLVIINITEGVKGIDRHFFDMFRIYAPSKCMILKELIAPALYPYYRSIILLGFVLSMKSSVIAEWFGAKSGVGKLINSYFYNFNITSFYAVSVVFIFLILFISFALKIITAPLLKRKKTIISPIAHFNDFSLLLTEEPKEIVLENVSFHYGKKKILNSINLSIKKNEVVVLTGKSGSGKTTLARLLSGFLKADTGIVHRTNKPAIIYQDDLLLSHLDLIGNVSLPARAVNDTNALVKAQKALELCGLADFNTYFIDEISGGMRKRVTFARALLLDPDFIILDEPFNNLDAVSRTELWDLFFQLFVSRGIPALIITHYPDELKNRNVRFVSLDNGYLE